MTTIQHLTNKAIAVTGLPEGVWKLTISNSDLGFKVGTKRHVRLLPTGNWSILCFSQDLKEEDWKRVVGEDDGKLAGFVTDQERGHSLLKAKGLHVSNPYSKPIMSDYSFPEDGPTDSMLLSAEHDFEFKYAKWQSAELLTNPLILIQ